MSDADSTATTSIYQAVIAYVPDEFIWCDWLHRQLNGALVPPALAGQRTRHGFPRPSELSVFPDPRNAADLASCAAELPPCRYLILVCSPQSGRAPELEEQIRAFKKSEGEDRIIVFVVDADADGLNAGGSDHEWVPAWLRWRLESNGTFRCAGEGEPLVIDARTGRMTLPEARAQLLAALLDLPRGMLREHGDLVTLEAAATLASHPEETVPATPVSTRRGSRVFAMAALLMLGIGTGAAWWKMQPEPKSVAAEVTETLPVQIETATPTPRVVTATRETDPVAVPVIAKSSAEGISRGTPRPSLDTSVTTIAGLAAKPLSTPTVAAPPKVVPPPPARVLFTSSEGPVTPISKTKVVAAVANATVSEADWRRLRMLGDTLIERGSRDSGLIALSQAAEVAVKQVTSGNGTSDERIEVARLCFRVGALQRQYFTVAEAKRTLAAGLRTLQAVPAQGHSGGERAALMEHLTRLLQGI